MSTDRLDPEWRKAILVWHVALWNREYEALRAINAIDDAPAPATICERAIMTVARAALERTLVEVRVEQAKWKHALARLGVASWMQRTTEEALADFVHMRTALYVQRRALRSEKGAH